MPVDNPIQEIVAWAAHHHYSVGRDEVAAARPPKEENTAAAQELTSRAIAGYPEHLASQLLGLASVKRFGVLTLGPVLDSLGLKSIAFENPETLELYREQRTKRDAAQVGSAVGRWAQADEKSDRFRPITNENHLCSFLNMSQQLLEAA